MIKKSARSSRDNDIVDLIYADNRVSAAGLGFSLLELANMSIETYDDLVQLGFLNE